MLSAEQWWSPQGSDWTQHPGHVASISGPEPGECILGFFVGFLCLVFFFTPSVQFWTGKWCKVNELLTIKCINIQKLLFSLCLQSQHCFNKKTNKQKPHISASLHQTGQAKRSEVYNVYSFDAAYPETALLQEMWCCASCHCTYAH